METSRRELSEAVILSFSIGTPLVVEQSSLENDRRGGAIYTIVHGSSAAPVLDSSLAVRERAAAVQASPLFIRVLTQFLPPGS